MNNIHTQLQQQAVL